MAMDRMRKEVARSAMLDDLTGPEAKPTPPAAAAFERGNDESSERSGRAVRLLVIDLDGFQDGLTTPHATPPATPLKHLP